MSRGPKYSTDPSMVARGSYPSYPFQMKPASSANPNTQPPFGPAEPFRETNKNPEYGLANAPGAVSIPPMDWAINVLRLEKSKHTETLTALHSVQKSNLHLENLLRQERSFNHILRQKAQEAEMERIFLEGQLRVFQQQNMEPVTPSSNYKSAASSLSANSPLPSITEITALVPGKRHRASTTPPAKRQRVKTISPGGESGSGED